MVTVLATQHKVRLFASPDLKRWETLSDFGPAGATGGVWECPDLFPLPVDGNSNDMRWVLDVDINPGGVAGGSGGQYFIGSFDGTRFVNENPPATTLWADYGKDFYATISVSDIPPTDGRRIWMAWISNWQYANDEPTVIWRGAQSVPRELALRRVPDGIRLVQQPVAELRSLRTSASPGCHHHADGAAGDSRDRTGNRARSVEPGGSTPVEPGGRRGHRRRDVHPARGVRRPPEVAPDGRPPRLSRPPRRTPSVARRPGSRFASSSIARSWRSSPTTARPSSPSACSPTQPLDRVELLDQGRPGRRRMWSLRVQP